MLGNPGGYANKKRKKPVLKQKRPSEDNEVVKSNPSKRHRDRLNAELDRLTDLLPFSEDTRTRLDKLSVLRLSVGYLRVKSYFKATMKNGSLMIPGVNRHNGNHMNDTGFSEGDLLLQAFNGFVIVVTSEAQVFYVSATVKDYLGFHQSDVVHQSVLELIHADDRELFRQQLHFALKPSTTDAGEDALQSNTMLYSPQQLPPENSSFLERSFVCRFRCLLDNSSGFLALKFQGRLKYLHGQRFLSDNRACDKPQLALFALAMPVQPPSIVEIRAKMLLFRSKHKLDFTPMGIDSRGRVVLGYSETEICMKGSGYQFVHAADMMYCADNHMRMFRTGESGMTVFRLLSKSGGWVWVKSNAKLIYKDGRPEFIIAYQRALVNTEGEEYLRQRRLQLPFGFTTGEAVLYDTGPTVDIAQFQFNKMFNKNDMDRDVTPGSLLDCFLKQDESAYTQRVDSPLPVDQVFMDSRALVSVPSDPWLESGARATTSDPVVMKTEDKQSIVTMIDNLETMVKNGDLCSVLQNLDVDESEVMELENALKRLSQYEGQQHDVSSELDSILASDLFEYIDTVLFSDKGEDCLTTSPPSCITAVNNHQQDLFTQAGLCEPPVFQTQSPVRTFPPMNGICSNQQNTMNGQMITGQRLTDPAHIFSRTQKISRHAPAVITQADPSLPPPQPLQLQDIFSPSIELPELTVADASADSTPTLLQSCGQVSISHTGCPQRTSGQMQSSQLLSCPQNNLQAPAMAAQLLQSSVKQQNNVASGAVDILPPLIRCSDLNSSSTPKIPIPFSAACLQGSPMLETHNHQIQQWPQSQRQKLPHAGILQNGHELIPACNSQTSGSQTFPRAGLWPRNVTELNHTQQGGLACGQEANHSSCMFNQRFSSSTAEGGVMALSGFSSLSGADTSLDQSPPQGSCYFQWDHSEPVVGSSAINQENAIISPLTAPPCMSSSEHTFNTQHYL